MADDHYYNNDINMDDMDVLAEATDPFMEYSQPPHPEQPPLLAEEAPRILDDVERMICHEDFPALLAKATKVKEMRQAMNVNTISSPNTPGNVLDPYHVICAVERMKSALTKKGTNMIVVTKGMYPLTDSMIQESFEILQQELERCQEWYNNHKEGAIAVKYAKWQTDILMNWMIEHKEHPFPDAQQIKQLGDETGLTHSQIINWTTNVRKRNLKATVQGGKKPHHFIDFVFLAHDRDKREGRTGAPPPPVKQTKTAPSRRKNHVKAKEPKQQPSEHPLAFRPYPGGPVYFPAPPSYARGGYSQPPSHAGGGYQQQQHSSYYQHPFPPPPYAYQQGNAAQVPAAKDRWMGDKESATMTARPETDAHLASFAHYWKQDKPSFHHANDKESEALTAEAQGDNVMSHKMERSLMVGPMETTPQRDSLNSLELIDLADDANTFLDELDLIKNVTEI